ncbi:DinB family protein [Rhizobium sp. SGZ-381]|uniref:DinB family protein n=1 Tax=Rhizobium sp. SGZ-381 TaxID=3342800 RepID=UPI003672C68A
MTPNRYFLVQAYNNAWANHRLLGACRTLTPQELQVTRTSFFPSILKTLNHILTVDWFYVSALEGRPMGPSAFEPELPFLDFTDLEREQRAIDRRLIDHCRQMTPDDLEREVVIPRQTHEQRERADRLLLHLFQHQIHHRGQVHAMLSGTRTKPPQLDEFFCASATDQALRRGDLAELGFSETQIWD